MITRAPSFASSRAIAAGAGDEGETILDLQIHFRNCERGNGGNVPLHPTALSLTAPAPVEDGMEKSLTKNSHLH
jgi:hypothetical protein